LVNEDAETLGVADDDDVEVLAGVDEAAAELEVELEDELPHAATPRLAVTASAAKTNLLLSKRTLTSLSLRDKPDWAMRHSPGPAPIVTMIESGAHCRVVRVNEPLTSG
jgi:hypothetical protein